MAFPSRSNTRIGLPPSPAPRSRSLSARSSRQDIPSRPTSTFSEERPRTRETLPPLPNSLRTQHSLNDLRSSSLRGRKPPPPLPDLKHLNSLRLGDGLESKLSKESIASLSSGSSSLHSSSSSISSLFSSTRPPSSAWSDSSFEDEGESGKGFGRSSLKPGGLGLSLWNKVATAAGNLTVSVSKAIETNVASYSGESKCCCH